MKWIKEPFVNGLAFVGTMMIMVFAAANDWLDRRAEGRERVRVNDIGAFKEERWWSHIRK